VVRFWRFSSAFSPPSALGKGNSQLAPRDRKRKALSIALELTPNNLFLGKKKGGGTILGGGKKWGLGRWGTIMPATRRKESEISLLLGPVFKQERRDWEHGPPAGKICRANSGRPRPSKKRGGENIRRMIIYICLKKKKRGVEKQVSRTYWLHGGKGTCALGPCAAPVTAGGICQDSTMAFGKKKEET